MIQSLSLENFKCFSALDLRLAPLTLLTGFNAAGKSTAIHTLLLLAQTLRTHSNSGELRLNGSLVSLGSPGEVLNESNARNELRLGFSTHNCEFKWLFSLMGDSSRKSLVATNLVGQVRGNTISPLDVPAAMFPAKYESEFGKLSADVEKLIYLSATRKNDSDVFPVPEVVLAPGDPGRAGEFSPWNFYRYADDAADIGRCFPSPAEPGTIRKELNSWLSAIFPGAQANALPISKTDLVKLEFRTSAGDEWHRPSNVGFGLSYAFPMLVAGMCSDRGQTIIVDSPEAHLHPSGQSAMGRFAAHIAKAGQQMIIETHSDHFLNGVRLALREGVISPSDVAIYFFSSKPESSVVELSADLRGNLSSWPPGFFDQAENDLAALAGWV